MLKIVLVTALVLWLLLGLCAIAVCIRAGQLERSIPQSRAVPRSKSSDYHHRDIAAAVAVRPPASR